MGYNFRILLNAPMLTPDSPVYPLGILSIFAFIWNLPTTPEVLYAKTKTSS